MIIKNQSNKAIKLIENKSLQLKLFFAKKYINKNLEKSIIVFYKNEDEEYEDKLLNPSLDYLSAFEAGFNKDIWYNLKTEQQILVLMWYEDYLANKHNRESAIFNISINATEFDLFIDSDNNVVYQIPFVNLLYGDELSYDYAKHIIELSSHATCIAKGKKFFKKNNNLKNKIYITELFSKEEINQYLSYLKQDSVKLIKEDLKDLELAGSRNNVYISEDNFFDAFKEDLKYEQELEKKIIEDNIELTK